ncbi:MAG: sigma-70 family RNA polymerase sigma factor [Eubacterium sp.]|nr:sigma-70 family RNA polymerase sigma factor [Eubacterium sp.]
MLCLLLSMADTPEQKRKIERLYDKYQKLMYTVAYRILQHHEDTEDAVFASWEKIIRNLDKIKKIDCQETKSFFVIVVERTAIDLYRKKHKRFKRELLTDQYEETPYYATAEMGFARSEMLDAFHRIPKTYSEVMILYYVNEFSIKEIADLLKIEENAVAKRLSRGRKMLRKEK